MHVRLILIRNHLILFLWKVVGGVGRSYSFIEFRTFRKDCPVELSLRASEDGMSLVVKKFVAEHNHVVSRVRPLIVHNAHGMYIIIDYIF